jgi:hypothetical protein
MDNPNLVDPGTRYYLFNSLQKSHHYRVKYYSIIFNILVFIFFIGGTALFLYWRYKEKPSNAELKARRDAEERYILSKIRFYQEEKKKIDNKAYQRITDLPVDKGMHYVVP